MKKTIDETNMLIADKAVQFLKNHMIINQQIIEIQSINSALGLGKNITISFEDFMCKYNKLDKRICTVSDSDNSQQKQLLKMRRELVRVYADFITLSEEQIDELMGYVRKSIETFGLGESSSSSSETYFLRKVLRKLRDDIDDKLGKDKESNEEYQKVNNWTSYSYLSDSVGFNDKIIGILDHGYRDAFSITTHDYKKFCEIDYDGVDKVTEPIDEDIFIGNNIYYGKLYKKSKSGPLYKKTTILLRKEVNGQQMMKDIYSDGKYYTLESSKNNNEYAVPLMTINDLFAMSGLNYLIRDVYDKYTFDRTFEAYYNDVEMTVEKKEQIEKVIQVAVDWWANAVCHPKFDDNDKKDFEGMIMLLDKIDNDNMPMLKEETIEKFKQYLGDEIRMGLVSRPDRCYSISVDYNPDIELSNAAKKAQLIVRFPIKTRMSISTEKVEVDKEIIYKKEEYINKIKDEEIKGQKSL